MRARLTLAAALVALGLTPLLGLAPAEAASRLIIMEPELDGDLSMPGQAAAWEQRLELIAHQVADGLQSSGAFDVVDPATVEDELARHRRRRSVYACEPCATSVAAAAAADEVLSIRVFRMSQLVLSAQLILRDGASGDVLYSRAADFRGDTDESWLRAISYLVDNMIEAQNDAASREN